VELRILGPLRVVDGDRDVAVAGPRERALLVALACRAGDAVGGEALIDALWGEDAPRSANKLLQNHVLRLRRAIGADAIETRDGGYALAGPVCVDSTRFETLVHEARAKVAQGAHAAAASRFRDALEMWRGPPYNEVADWAPAAAEGARLSEVHRSAEEEAIDARLEAGEAAECVGDLETLVAAQPMREHRWVLLMLALYRSGRQAEALRAYQRARTTLAEELGVEPGPELRATEQAVIAHDPALVSAHDADLQAQRATNRRLRVFIAVVAAALVLAVVAVIVAVAQRGHAQQETRRAQRSASAAVAARIDALTRTLPAAQSDLALLLGVEGRRQFPAGTADAGLESALARTPSGLNRVIRLAAPSTLTTLSPDDRVLAAPASDGNIGLYDLASGRLVRTLARTSASGCAALVRQGSLCTPAAAFSADTKLVAGGGFPSVTIWRVATGETFGPPIVPGGSIVFAVFDPVRADRLFTAGNDGTVAQWDLRDPSRPTAARLRFPIGSEDSPAVFVSADGRRIAAGGFMTARTDVWDLASHRLLFETAGTPGPFSPDGRTLVTATGGAVVVHDASTGAVVGPPIPGVAGASVGMSFRADGRRIAVGELGQSPTVRVFDTASRALVSSLGPLHHPIAYPAGFLRDGRLVSSGSSEAALWTVDSPASPMVHVLGAAGVAVASFDPTNGEVITNSAGGVQVWDAQTGAPRGRFLGGRVTTWYLPAFSGDGALVAAGGNDGSFAIWDVATGRQLVRTSTGRAGWVAVAWDKRRPVLATLTTASAPGPQAQDASTTLWDVSNPTRPAPAHALVLPTRVGFPTFSFSGDGSQLAVGTGTGGSTTIFDTATGSVVHTIRADYGIPEVAFAQSSVLAVVSGEYAGNRLARWDTATWRSDSTDASTLLDGVALVNNETRIVTTRFPELSSANSMIELWDRATLQPFGEPIPVRTQEAFLAYANATGTKVGVGTTDGNASVIDLDPASWQATACAVAGRNLTRVEWSEYFPGRPYAVTCPQWPPG